MSEYYDAGLCPKCKDCHTFTREENGHKDYQWDETVGTYIAVEVENDNNPLTCSACGAIVDEEASKEAGRVVLESEDELLIDMCPKCKGTSYERAIGGISVYFNESPEEFNGNKGYFETCTEPDFIDSSGKIRCVKCGAIVDERASKKAGRIILKVVKEPEPDPRKVNIEIVFTAEMVQDYVRDTFDFEPSVEAIKAFFDDKDTWIVNYLHEAGWDLITNNAYEFFQNTAVFNCKECGAESKYTKEEGFGLMQIERFNVMKLCEDCLRKHGGGEGEDQ